MNTPIASPGTGARAISPFGAHAGISSALLIDVRTPAEFETSHIEGSLSHPLDTLNPAGIESLASEKDLCLVICQTGGRARSAAEKLRAAKLPEVCILDGGVDAWVQAGLPVVEGPRRVLPLMRQVQIAVGTISATGAALALWKNPLFAIIPLLMGCGLMFAGITGFCGLAMLLAKMPWNRASGPSCCSANESGKESHT